MNVTLEKHCLGDEFKFPACSSVDFGTRHVLCDMTGRLVFLCGSDKEAGMDAA